MTVPSHQQRHFFHIIIIEMTTSVRKVFTRSPLRCAITALCSGWRSMAWKLYACKPWKLYDVVEWEFSPPITKESPSARLDVISVSTKKSFPLMTRQIVDNSLSLKGLFISIWRSASASNWILAIYRSGDERWVQCNRVDDAENWLLTSWWRPL